MIEGISAVTLGTHEMPRAVRFYCALGFEVLHGNEQSSFTSFRATTTHHSDRKRDTTRRGRRQLPSAQDVAWVERRQQHLHGLACSHRRQAPD